ncbi:MAG: aspartate kinase [Saprospiraceae bacterium]|nr:aspartate kinase [Saprospiraceae bacterium]
MSLKVFKFGGASVKDANGVQNVAKILNAHSSKDKILTVVSATGKTTNALELVVQSYYNQDGKANEHLQSIKNDHVSIMQGLDIFNEEIAADISDTFVEIDWMIEDEVQDGFNYIYDQIVSVGELVSSKILYHRCKKEGLNVCWLDVRDVLITDNSYREAKVLWNDTQKRMDERINDLFGKFDIIITQGFIGCSTENFNTTLGREGSDFTAGIFSYCLDAESLSIWKDVPGILTADPRLFENVTKIDRLDYREAIEMTYFGAKVIHPKTIKPLQNKNIPLYVRPFNDYLSEGTLITSNVDTVYPPVIVIESGQALIHISTKDFSFVAEEHLSEIFERLDTYKLKVNMMRNTAISFSVAVQNDPKKISKLMEDLSMNYNVLKDDDLELITVRHYDDATVTRMKEGKIVLFEETFRQTVRMAVKDIPVVKRK